MGAVRHVQVDRLIGQVKQRHHEFDPVAMPGPGVAAKLDRGGVGGLGLTRVLSHQPAAAMKAGRLAILLSDFEPEPWPVHLVHEPRALLPQKLRALLDFAVPWIAVGIA